MREPQRLQAVHQALGTHQTGQLRGVETGGRTHIDADVSGPDHLRDADQFALYPRGRAGERTQALPHHGITNLTEGRHAPGHVLLLM
ncbi:Uncharacterised protein [Mycobacteroides abscessus subsp. abscessus]|nr:Uncharacterised protein [Mycobacteroides abscessus subsp. abscessus]